MFIQVDYLSSTQSTQANTRDEAERGPTSKAYQRNKRTDPRQTKNKAPPADMSFWTAHSITPTDQVLTHHMGYVAVTTSNPASQLRAMLPELEWQDAGTMSALQYADLARVSAAAITTHSEMRTRAWLKYGVTPAHLCKSLTAPLEGLEKTASHLGSIIEDVDHHRRPHGAQSPP